jgi:hypothetical protein
MPPRLFRTQPGMRRPGYVLGILRICGYMVVVALVLSGAATRSAYVVPSGINNLPVSPDSVFLRAGQQTSEKDSCDKYANKAAPNFRVARKVKPDEKTGLELSISLEMRDFMRDKLVTLACKLGKDHADEQALFVWVLDDYQAAKDYTAGPIANGENNNLSFRAVYRFSREKGSEIQTLTWWPDPTDRDHSLQVDLGSPPPPKPASR